MIEPQDIPPHLIYEWAPLTRQDIADVLNDEERMPERPDLPCWECGHRTTEEKCPNCGFDSAVQADGGWLIPPRFTPVVEAMVRGEA